MMADSIKTVAVIGAGTMGQGIAQVCATAGLEVVLYDVNDRALTRALSQIKDSLSVLVSKGKLPLSQAKSIEDGISPQPEISRLRANLFIEAIVEDLGAKQELFKTLESSNREAIFTTNTSSISITQIAAVMKQPERFAGLHFFNPATLMKLVEVVKGSRTSQAVVETLTGFSLKLGKQPVVAQDSPGFIVNRVARHFYVEALKLLEENVAPYEKIDKLLRSSGFRMGPFELMDLIGMDVNFAVTSSIYAGFHNEPRFRPSRIQQQKVDAGELGRKTGRGFYDYADQPKQ